MDTLTSLYDRLRQRAAAVANQTSVPEEPPLLQDWLRFWNDDDTDLGNLRNFEHWMSKAKDRAA